MAVVAEGNRGRVYLSPTEEIEKVTKEAAPEWKPEQTLPVNPRDFKTPNYGMNTFGDLFTDRQLVALNTFSDLIAEAREKAIADAEKAGLDKDGVGLDAGGCGATAYGDAVVTYLAFAVDRIADRSSSICSWDYGYVKVRNTFGRQAIPMVWDYAEANIFSSSTGNFMGAIEWIKKVINQLPAKAGGKAVQADVHSVEQNSLRTIFATDPPYYDNIGYADLSDFFYVWLRRGLKHIYPDLFKTMLVPKTQELVATPYRFEGNKHKAENFFESGMKAAFGVMHANHNVRVSLVFILRLQTGGEKGRRRHRQYRLGNDAQCVDRILVPGARNMAHAYKAF